MFFSIFIYLFFHIGRKKIMKENMNKERIYDLGREIENLLYELKFETNDDFFIELDKMIAEHCQNFIISFMQ